MRKTLFIAAIAALTMISSCQKEIAPVQDSLSDEQTFTATIVEPETKTIINTDASSADRGKVIWEVGDEISITDGIDTAIYYLMASSDKAADGSASFTYKSGKRLSASAAKYTATFGNAITDVQSYSVRSVYEQNFPMSGESDPSDKTKLNFKVSCGLLNLALSANSTETDRTISKIEVTGTPIGGSKKIYTLTCNNTSLPAGTSVKYFHILLPAGDYTTMKFTNSTGNICFKTAKTPMVIKANTVQPVTLTGLAFTALLPGKFTVNAEGKQVRFSQGNLYCKRTSSESNDWTWGFYSHQYDYNSLSVGKDSRTAADTDTEIDLFTWGYDEENSVIPTTVSYNTTMNIIQGTVDDWGYALSSSLPSVPNNWMTLKDTEWGYLLYRRNGDNAPEIGGMTDVRYAEVKVNGICGMLIFPDSFSWPSGIATPEPSTFNTYKSDWNGVNYTATEFEQLESAGCAFLPASGWRSDAGVYDIGSRGNYWSSTRNGQREAYTLKFYDTGVFPQYSFSRSNGYSIRLVSDVK